MAKPFYKLPQNSPHWPLYIAALLKDTIVHPERPAVLCLGRPHFDRDVGALMQHSQKYNWLHLGTPIMSFIQRDWVPDEAKVQSQYHLFRGEKYDIGWEKCQALCEQILAKVQKHTNVVAVVSANFDYWVDEGFRRACRKMNIPFLVLMREHVIQPVDQELDGNYYCREKYTLVPNVSGVAVGGDVTRDVLLGCNIFKPDKIRITGLPRLDPWIPILNKHEAPPEKLIVLLSFTDPTYRGGGTFKEILTSFVAVEHKHRGDRARFIVKCKDSEDQEAVEDILAAYPGHGLIVTTDDAFPILAMASVVIGFNSLALIEALLSKARILVPQWGGTRTDRKYQIFWREDPAHRNVMGFMESLDDLIAEIDVAVAAKYHVPDMAARIKVVQSLMMFDPSVPAASRVEDFVDHFVDQAS